MIQRLIAIASIFIFSGCSAGIPIAAGGVVGYVVGQGVEKGEITTPKLPCCSVKCCDQKTADNMEAP